MSKTITFFLLGLECLLLGPPLWAQTLPFDQREAWVWIDSGDLINQGSSRALVFEETLEVAEATWLRLIFDEAHLGAALSGPQTQLRITSLTDGATQTLNAIHLQQWGYTSAYFNGNAVKIELLASPGARPSRLRISRVWAGNPDPNQDRSICGDTDDRILSQDPRAGRVSPVNCTGWLIDDNNRCLLSAGHCTGGSFGVMEFNVPLSTSTGQVQHPGPEDQYPIDPASIQTTGNAGIGNDWSYYGCFPNSNTGLTAAEAQGGTYILGAPPASPAGQNIRITGYGSTTAALAPLEWNSVQKTHLGPLVSVTSTTLNYQTDTTGGNSGSPIIHEETGFAIGVHTHAGCSTTQGNNGTNILLPSLQNALANPLGICLGPPPLLFDLSQGRPLLFSPEGQVLRIEVSGQNGATPQAGTGMLSYDLNQGGGEQTIPMIEVSPNVYDAVFPLADCGTQISYRFSARTDGNEIQFLPSLSNQRFRAEVAASLDTTFNDSFEGDQGWSVENDPGLSDGAWERGFPASTGIRGDPPFDGDSSGFCFLTDNQPGNSDVDGGHTVLVSPAMDATMGDAHIHYWRWYSNADGGNGDDVFLIEVSDDDGNNWTQLETVGPTGPETNGGWVRQSFRIADFITETDQFRIRFDASDLGTGSVVEAAIDGVRLSNGPDGYLCPTLCPADLNLNGTIDMDDYMMLLARWGSDEFSDLNQDQHRDLLDLLEILATQGPCP